MIYLNLILATAAYNLSIKHLSLGTVVWEFSFWNFAWELSFVISSLGALAWDLWFWILGLGSLAWGLWLGKSSRANRLAAAGGIGLGVSQPLPFKKLNKNTLGKPRYGIT